MSVLAEAFCLRLLNDSKTPNISHRKLVAEVDAKFTAGAGVKAIEALVAAKKINRGEMKIGLVNYVWYYPANVPKDTRQQVLNKLVVSCAKGDEPPAGCIVSQNMSHVYGFYRDVMCGDVVAEVLAVRPKYAHDMGELLIELGVLPSPPRLSALFKHLNITSRNVKEKNGARPRILSYGNATAATPAAAAAAASSSVTPRNTTAIQSSSTPSNKKKKPSKDGQQPQQQSVVALAVDDNDGLPAADEEEEEEEELIDNLNWDDDDEDMVLPAAANLSYESESPASTPTPSSSAILNGEYGGYDDDENNDNYGSLDDDGDDDEDGGFVEDPADGLADVFDDSAPWAIETICEICEKSDPSSQHRQAGLFLLLGVSRDKQELREQLRAVPADVAPSFAATFWFKKRIDACTSVTVLDKYAKDLMHRRQLLSHFMTQLEWNRRAQVFKERSKELLGPLRMLYVNYWAARFHGTMLLPVLDYYAMKLSTKDLNDLLEECARIYFPELARFSHELRHDMMTLYGLSLGYKDLIRAMAAVYPRYHNGAKYQESSQVLHSKIPPYDFSVHEKMSDEELMTLKAATYSATEVAMRRLMPGTAAPQARPAAAAAAKSS